MESPNEFMKRASRRNKILGDLDTSAISEQNEQENLPEDDSTISLHPPSILNKSNGTIILDSDLDSSTLSASTDKKGDFASSAASSSSQAPAPRTPLKSVNNLSSFVVDTPVPTSPLKSKLNQLAANYNDFNAEIKPTSKSKEDYVHGPQRRVSVEPKHHYHYEVPAVKSDSHGSIASRVTEKHVASPTKSSSLYGHAAPTPYKNKLSQLVETFNNIQAPPQPRYNHPSTAAGTKIRPYNHPNPTKKPASCEIVSGPTFMQSMSYWQNRAHELPFGYRNRVPSVTKAPIVKRAPFEQVRAEPPPRVEPTPAKPTTPVRHDSSEAASTSNDETFFPDPPEAFKTVKFSPVVVNLPEPKYSAEDENPVSPLEPESSELLSPVGPSLLDDINQDFTKIHTPRSQRTSNLSDGSNSSKPVLVHSLSNYRKNEVVPAKERTPSDLEVFEEDDVSPVVDNNSSRNSDEMTREIPADHIQHKLKGLATSKRIVIDQVQQTEKALRVARRNNYRSGYQNYTQEIDLLHTLSTLTERRKAIFDEERRLTSAKELYYTFPRATLRFTKIAVSVHENLEILPNHYAYLFALVRYNDQVYSTSALYINPMISQGIGSIEFNDIIEVEDVSPDFSMSIEIYGITLIRKDSRNDHRFNLKRMVSSPQPERQSAAHHDEQFSRVGQVVIELGDLKQQVLQLSSFQSPLSGKCRLHIQPKLTDPDTNKWSGFLSIYRMVDGRGSWELCYSNICNNRLNFWRYPEDADTKDPILSINLRDMVETAKPCNASKLGFQNDFEIKVLDGKDNVIGILLSTAEEKDLHQVMKAVNRSFKYIKTWPLS